MTFENKVRRRLSITNVAPGKSTVRTNRARGFCRLTTAAQRSCSPNVSAVL